jgi:hypothetical protein
MDVSLQARSTPASVGDRGRFRAGELAGHGRSKHPDHGNGQRGEPT